MATLDESAEMPLAASFVIGPGGADFAAWERGAHGYGAITVLSFMRDRGLALDDVLGILDSQPCVSRRRSGIAVRTAAIVTDARATERVDVLEHGSEYDIMNAY